MDEIIQYFRYYPLSLWPGCRINQRIRIRLLMVMSNCSLFLTDYWH